MIRLARAALLAGLLHAPVPAAPLLSLPPPGSYRLERIMQAPDGAVLDSDGSRHRMAEFTTGG